MTERRLMAKNKTIAEFDSRVRKAALASGLTGEKRVVVAVSGGPDSMALLNALSRLAKELGLVLHGAHLDHGLRGAASDADALTVASLFTSFAIPFTVEKANVAGYRRARGLSMEEAARDVRYAFLARVALDQKAHAVALGHTADDQAETVLMHILRGSGVHGLRGMAQLSERVIEDNVVWLFRPMLELRRADTIEYCRALGMTPRIDESNLDTNITRNRVRLELMPLLETYNPAVQEALVRLARSAAESDDYIAGELSRVLPHLVTEVPGGVSIDRRRFVGVQHALHAATIRELIRDVKGDLDGIEQTHVDGVLELMWGQAGKAIDLPGDLTVINAYDSMVIAHKVGLETPLSPLIGEVSIPVPGEGLLGQWRITVIHAGADMPNRHAYPVTTTRTTPDGLLAYLSAEAIAGGLTVRQRRPGDRFQPLGMAGEKKLQDFMVDEKIDRRLRDRVPLVVAGGRIAWVVGWRIAEWAKAVEGQATVEIRFLTSSVLALG